MAQPFDAKSGKVSGNRFRSPKTFSTSRRPSTRCFRRPECALVYQARSPSGCFAASLARSKRPADRLPRRARQSVQSENLAPTKSGSLSTSPIRSRETPTSGSTRPPVEFRPDSRRTPRSTPRRSGLPMEAGSSSFRFARATPTSSKSSNGAGNDEPILVSPRTKYPPDWSRDGRFILFRAIDEETNFELWYLPVGGQQQPVPFLKATFGVSHGQFSPDGKWVAYASNESGKWEIYVTSFPTPGGNWKVSSCRRRRAEMAARRERNLLSGARRKTDGRRGQGRTSFRSRRRDRRSSRRGGASVFPRRIFSATTSPPMGNVSWSTRMSGKRLHRPSRSSSTGRQP